MHTLEKGSGKPVIFFHGWSVDAYAAKHLIDELSKHFRVIAPTMPGFHPSMSLPKNVTTDFFGSVLGEWFDAIHAHKACVIGHSLGGAFAVLFASGREKNIEQLILVDAVGVPLDRTGGQIIQQWLKKRTRQYKTYGTKLVSRIERAFIKNAIMKTPDLIRLAKFAATIDIRENLRHLRLPLDLLWGTEDELMPIAIAYELQKVAPHARLHTVERNHDWPLFEPELILPFLKAS